jgi:hypothetical protein
MISNRGNREDAMSGPHYSKEQRQEQARQAAEREDRIEADYEKIDKYHEAREEKLGSFAPLPGEVMANIQGNLDPQSLASMNQTSSYMYEETQGELAQQHADWEATQSEQAEEYVLYFGGLERSLGPTAFEGLDGDLLIQAIDLWVKDVQTFNATAAQVPAAWTAPLTVAERVRGVIGTNADTVAEKFATAVSLGASVDAYPDLGAEIEKIQREQ